MSCGYLRNKLKQMEWKREDTEIYEAHGGNLDTVTEIGEDGWKGKK